MVSTHPKNISQIGNLPQIRVKIKKTYLAPITIFVELVSDSTPIAAPATTPRSVADLELKESWQKKQRNVVCGTKDFPGE